MIYGIFFQSIFLNTYKMQSTKSCLYYVGIFKEHLHRLVSYLTPYINHLLRKSFCTEARLLATSHLIRTTTFSKKVENADKKVYWPKTKLMSISSDNAIRSLSLMECVRSSTYFEFLDRASDDPVDHKITC